MTHLRVPVHPETYFVDHAQGNRVPFSANDYTTRVPRDMLNFIDFARHDIPPQRETKSHIASLAVEFGADRPLIDWDIPVDRLADINYVAQRVEQDSLSSIGGKGLPKYHAKFEPVFPENPVGYRMSRVTREQIDMYQSVLRVSRSVAVRHCMAISFCYYNEAVVDGDQAQAWIGILEKYRKNFKRELETRVEYAQDELGMDI